MYREKHLTPKELAALLRKNAVKRNDTINTFIRLLNSVTTNTYLSIDGRWGSGKTIFIRQLEQLNYMDLEDTESQQLITSGGLDESAIEIFQTKYLAYYYNAWQNDDHKDPIQSLLFNLIHDFQIKDGLKEMAKNATKQVVKDSLLSGAKTLSRGLIDLDSLKNVKTLNSLADDITTSSERKRAVSDIISSLLPEGKKLLFLIDELDRCAPTFAVNMLEAVKHYYDNDNIVFVISTNNTQLAHTVRKYYGSDFDGAKYLNRFYDLVFDLPEINSKDFILGHLMRKNDSMWYNIVPERIAIVLEMSMRDMTRYYSSLDIISDYITAQSSWSERLRDFTKYIFVPLALALKTIDTRKYADFRTGKGVDILREVCSKDNVIPRMAHGYVDQESKEKPQRQVEIIVETYTELFSGRDNQENYEAIEEYKRFQELITLINSTGKIDT